MCFNTVKNKQLGWFDDKFATIDTNTRNWSGDLLGQIDYPNGIVGVQMKGSSDDYYVGFNRKLDHNSGTVEGGDQVLVHQRSRGLGYGESTLLAKLNAGQSFTIADFDNEGIL